VVIPVSACPPRGNRDRQRVPLDTMLCLQIEVWGRWGAAVCGKMLCSSGAAGLAKPRPFLQEEESLKGLVLPAGWGELRECQGRGGFCHFPNRLSLGLLGR